jgi:hypothetical protein
MSLALTRQGMRAVVPFSSHKFAIVTTIIVPLELSHMAPAELMDRTMTVGLVCGINFFRKSC